MDELNANRHTGAVVVSSHPLATEAAVATLKSRGSLADAAIAGGAVLAVVSQPATSLAGDAIILVREAASGAIHCLNATGRAPQGVDVTRFSSGMPWRGADTVTSPGLLKGWEALHLRFGRLPWRDLFGKAYAFAAEGFPVSKKLETDIMHYRDVLAADEGSRALFLPEGRPLKYGERLVQANLAGCIAEIAERGAKALYQGRMAASIARAVQRNGGALSTEDFAICDAVWVEPLGISYRGYDVIVPPPNSYGLALLLQLAALSAEPFPDVAVDSIERYRRLMMAAKVAFAASEPFIADPACAPPPQEALSEEFIGAVRCAFKAGQAEMASLPTGGTATLSIADNTGNAIIVLQSVMQEFGSGIVDPETGILLNNRMSGFTHVPRRANSVMPGKKPAHSLSPSIIVEGGALRFVIGTPGGSGQTVTLAQTINGLLDHRRPLAEVVRAPRWSLGRAGRLMVEENVPDEVVEGLGKAGMAVEKIRTHVPYFGSVEAIEIRKDGLNAVADLRREASVCRV